MSEKMKNTKISPRIPSGFMELLPKDQISFNWMLKTIQETYENFGFLPIETPVLELADVLLAKGGGETDKQVYRLKKGDTDLCLRFDLTVPLARYVAQYANDLTFPFRRYQIQRVYRGEGAQRGRYREFYQCDIDVIGENLNILNDAEIPAVIYDVFKKLKVPPFTILINNRKILNGIFEALGVSSQSNEAMTIIDKIDKVGIEVAMSQLRDIGFASDKISTIIRLVNLSGSFEKIEEELVFFKEAGFSNDNLANGISELKQVIYGMRSFEIPDDAYRVNLGIARGLDYYTGTIYETILNEYPEIGSVCSGGRYDDLCQHYTDRNLQGVGISIGLTRLFYQLQQVGAIQNKNTSTSRVLIAKMSGDDALYAMNTAKDLRSSGVSCEVYLDDAKIGKQFKYAARLGIPYVMVVGENERKNQSITIKDLESGKQQEVSLEMAIAMVNWEKNHK